MNRRSCIIALMALALLQEANSSASASRGLPDNGLATVARANTEFVKAAIQRNAALMASPYSSDALFVRHQNNLTRGQTAIEAMFRKWLDHTRFLSGMCSTDDVRKDGDELYESGHCSYAVERDGQRHMTGGRFLTLWRKENSGWVIVVNVAE